MILLILQQLVIVMPIIHWSLQCPMITVVKSVLSHPRKLLYHQPAPHCQISFPSPRFGSLAARASQVTAETSLAPGGHSHGLSSIPWTEGQNWASWHFLDWKDLLILAGTNYSKVSGLPLPCSHGTDEQGLMNQQTGCVCMGRYMGRISN